MTTHSVTSQDETVLMMPDPETAALADDGDDANGGAKFDEFGSGATSGYGDADLAEVDADEEDTDLSEELDETVADDLDDDSMN